MNKYEYELKNVKVDKYESKIVHFARNQKISIGTLNRRLQKGMNIETAVTTPVCLYKSNVKQEF